MSFVGGKYLKRCPFCDNEMKESIKDDGVWAVHPTEIEFDCYFRYYMFRVTDESRERWNRRFAVEITSDLIDIAVYAENIQARIAKIRGYDD